jgi:hypothetical protein
MPKYMISKLIKDAMPAIQEIGREEITKAHAVGRPGVYMIGDRIVVEYPGGEIVSLSEHRRRIVEATAAQIDIPGIEDMTEAEIDDLSDRLVREARADARSQNTD